VNVRVRDIRSGMELWVHHDRVSNPLIFRASADINVSPPTLNADSADEIPPADPPITPHATRALTPPPQAIPPTVLQPSPIREKPNKVNITVPNDSDHEQNLIAVPPPNSFAVNNNQSHAANSSCGLLFEFAGPMFAAQSADDELTESLRRDGWIVQYVKGWERVAGMHPRTGTIYYLSTSHHKFLTFAL
jgi:hypothetical protein